MTAPAFDAEGWMTLPAPAKLNLFLHVTGRRADGYHELETVFETIDLADRIGLRRREDDRIVLHTPIPGVDPESDLTVRAARLLAANASQDTPRAWGADLRIDKRIPMGAGLGGGSSDAATVLLGLNHLWGLGLTRQTLAGLGLRLGADVPFFVEGAPAAFATGVGETLRPIELPARLYVLVTPSVHVATADVFRDAELTRDTKPLKIDSLSQLRQVLQAIELGNNDLQPVVVRRFAPVADALGALEWSACQAGLAAGLARMSGSGSSVFVPVDDDETAMRVLGFFDEATQNRFARIAPTGGTEYDRQISLAGRCSVVRSLRQRLL